jgi:multidrug efflux pump
MLVTGMIIGTAFTLFVVPSIYVLVAKTHRKIEGAEAEKTELREAGLKEAAV